MLSISVCRSRSIIATCGEDFFVRIWNYYESEVDEKRGIISQQFKDLPYCVSLHPCGQFIAIAFGTWYTICEFNLINQLQGIRYPKRLSPFVDNS